MHPVSALCRARSLAVPLVLMLLGCLCRVRDFEVIDKVALGVEFSWKKDGEEITSVVFERNSPLPSVKVLTFLGRCASAPSLDRAILHPSRLGLRTACTVIIDEGS